MNIKYSYFTICIGLGVSDTQKMRLHQRTIFYFFYCTNLWENFDKFVDGRKFSFEYNIFIVFLIRQQDF